jgi:hypothetical protein
VKFLIKKKAKNSAFLAGFFGIVFEMGFGYRGVGG